MMMSDSTKNNDLPSKLPCNSLSSYSGIILRQDHPNLESLDWLYVNHACCTVEMPYHASLTEAPAKIVVLYVFHF